MPCHNCSHMQCLIHTRKLCTESITAGKQEALQDLHACPEVLNSKPRPQKNTEIENQRRHLPYQLPTDPQLWGQFGPGCRPWGVPTSADLQGFLILHSSFSEEKCKDYSWNCNVLTKTQYTILQGIRLTLRRPSFCPCTTSITLISFSRLTSFKLECLLHSHTWKFTIQEVI